MTTYYKILYLRRPNPLLKVSSVDLSFGEMSWPFLFLTASESFSFTFFLHPEFVVCSSRCCCRLRVKRGNCLRLKSKTCWKKPLLHLLSFSSSFLLSLSLSLFLSLFLSFFLSFTHSLSLSFFLSFFLISISLSFRLPLNLFYYSLHFFSNPKHGHGKHFPAIFLSIQAADNMFLSFFLYLFTLVLFQSSS